MKATITDYVSQGNQLKQEGKLEDAIACYQKALESNPDHPWTYYFLGEVFSQQNRLREAVNYYRKSIELNPEFSWSYHKIARILHKQVDLDQAVVYYQKDIELNPQNSWSYYFLGEINNQQNQAEKAIAYYRQAIELNPDFADTYYKLGCLLQETGQLTEAIACYRQSISLNSDNFWCWYYLGESLTKQSNFEEAITCYRRVIKLNQNFYAAHQRLGDLLQHQGQIAKAIAAYKQARYTRTIQVYSNFAAWPEYTYIVNHKYGFIYCPIPKVACSSLKKLILDLSPIARKEEALQIAGADFHTYVDGTISCFRYSTKDLQKILNSEKYFKFAFVRNPWNRLISAYLNKFVHLLEPYFQDVIRAVYNKKGLNPDYEKSITFNEFIHYLVDTEDEELNEHWKPQYLFLGDTKFDFIGKFENLAQDIRAIKEKLNLDSDLAWMNKTERQENINSWQDYSNYYPAQLKQLEKYPSFKNFYTPELIELVRQRYRQDIEQFNYEFV